MKQCPDCAESVLVAARICRFCRYEFARPIVVDRYGEALETLRSDPTAHKAVIVA